MLEFIFAAATPAAHSGGWLDSLKGGNLPFNWFDIAVVVVLGIGFARGRKHGMSVEMLFMLQWFAMISGAAWAYQPAADWLISVCPISRLSAYVVSYVTAVIIIRILFSIVRRVVAGKLLGSNMFGSAEYYLGMVAGIVRFACIIVLFAALINSRFYSEAEIKAISKYNTDLYGSNFFPNLQEIQTAVFQRSFIGKVINKRLAWFLIKPTPPENPKIQPPGEFQWQ